MTMNNNESFDKFVDKILNKDVPQQPKEKQESFDNFVSRVVGNNKTNIKSNETNEHI